MFAQEEEKKNQCVLCSEPVRKLIPCEDWELRYTGLVHWQRQVISYLGRASF